MLTIKFVYNSLTSNGSPEFLCLRIVTFEVL